MPMKPLTPLKTEVMSSSVWCCSRLLTIRVEEEGVMEEEGCGMPTASIADGGRGAEVAEWRDVPTVSKADGGRGAEETEEEED